MRRRRAPSLREIKTVAAALEELGLICRTGRFKRGEPQYTLSPLGLALSTKYEHDHPMVTLLRAEQDGVCRRTHGTPMWELVDPKPWTN
jgi:hypothetical protein